MARALAPSHEVWLGSRHPIHDLPGRPWPIDLRDFDSFPGRTKDIEGLDETRAASLIMTARAPWFAGEQQA